MGKGRGRAANLGGPHQFAIRDQAANIFCLLAVAVYLIDYSQRSRLDVSTVIPSHIRPGAFRCARTYPWYRSHSSCTS